MLPTLLDHPLHAPRRLALAAGAGLPTAALYLIIGMAVGLFVGFATFDIMVAFGGRYDPKAAYDPPGPMLAVVQDVLSYLVLWSGPAAGAAAAAAAGPDWMGRPGRSLGFAGVPARLAGRCPSATLA